MPLKDRLTLGPIDKYLIYHRFPVKLTLHITLVILMTVALLLQVNVD